MPGTLVTDLMTVVVSTTDTVRYSSERGLGGEHMTAEHGGKVIHFPVCPHHKGCHGKKNFIVIIIISVIIVSVVILFIVCTSTAVLDVFVIIKVILFLPLFYLLLQVLSILVKLPMLSI